MEIWLSNGIADHLLRLFFSIFVVQADWLALMAFISNIDQILHLQFSGNPD